MDTTGIRGKVPEKEKSSHIIVKRCTLGCRANAGDPYLIICNAHHFCPIGTLQVKSSNLPPTSPLFHLSPHLLKENAKSHFFKKSEHFFAIFEKEKSKTLHPQNSQQKSTSNSNNTSTSSNSFSMTSSSASHNEDLSRTNKHGIFRSRSIRFKTCNPQETHSTSSMTTPKTFLQRIPSLHRVNGKTLVINASTSSSVPSIEERSPSQSAPIRINTSLSSHESIHVSSQISRQDVARALDFDVRMPSSPTQTLYTHERLNPSRRSVTSSGNTKPYDSIGCQGTGNGGSEEEETGMYYSIPFYRRSWELHMGCE